MHVLLHQTGVQLCIYIIIIEVGILLMLPMFALFLSPCLCVCLCLSISLPSNQPISENGPREVEQGLPLERPASYRSSPEQRATAQRKGYIKTHISGGSGEGSLRECLLGH